ncbi:hypothetical protein [Tessaracoccus sp. OH4464_COT-324]|uniref:hypothetical protein n=1 Tax=Tessaracoccus sp. OH4464_COT-324 TaxID=2491059 RepID=UPI000F644E62|nr:hypothetical protein [Tessaracoccus sp. OH4464_COT-324]RRD46765.1 hypothetical protein EII42_05945 [Tessaracoccus sp. OH4464_COT-324]
MSDKVSERELQEQLAALTERVASLEAQLAALDSHKQIPEQHLVAIGAAVAAYFGHKAKVRAVRFRQQSRWAAASRGRVHDRSVPHVR